MPGPVSQSHDPDGTAQLRNNWAARLAREGIRYCVIPVDDLFRFATNEQLEHLDELLAQIETCRAADDFEPSHKYWVYGRHWPDADKVHGFMETCLGQRIGESYPAPRYLDRDR